MRTALMTIPMGVLICVSGCSSTSENTPASIEPTLSIESPSNNSSVKLSADKTVDVNFVTNYALRAPGQCGSDSHCGHVHVLIDGTACNSNALPYNSMATSSPATADFSKCQADTGQHKITLELHDDNHASIKDPVGNPVTADVTVTTAE